MVLPRSAGPSVCSWTREVVYEPWVAAFADRQALPGVSRETLDTRVLMLTALDACLRA